MNTAAAYFLSFWHVFLLFAILQALLLCFVLVDHNKENKVANRLLGFFLLGLGAVLAEYVLIDSGVFRLGGLSPHFLGLSIPILFLLGPNFYLYTTQLLQAPAKTPLSWRQCAHGVPAVLAAIKAYWAKNLWRAKLKARLLPWIFSTKGRCINSM